MLACTVRGCGRELESHGQTLRCGGGHSFDRARSGYVNLLQPQDRRSRNPGDTGEAVAARRRLHDRGVTAPLLEAIAEFSGVGAGDAVLDAGCGEGFFLGSLEARTGCAAQGVDIAIPAIEAAARRYPRCEWVVANADRTVPDTDGSFSVVLSITGRRNAAEFHRVLRVDGRLLVAIPAPNDLIELRGAGRDRVAGAVAEFATHFTLEHRGRASTTAELDAAGVTDVLLSIYRPRAPEAVRPGRVTFSRVTFSLDLLLLRPVHDPR